MALEKSDFEEIENYMRETLPRMLYENSAGSISAIYERDLRERIVRVEEELKNQRDLMKQGFEYMEKRFESMQQNMDKRFQQMDKRFESMQQSIDKRFEQVDKRFESMQQNIDKRFEDINTKFRMMFTFMTLGFTILAIMMTVFKYIG